MIRFAVVGTNWITERFIDAAHESGKLKLSAVYSRSLEQAQAFGANYQVTQFFDSLEAMAQSDAIDAVYIASPNSLHCPQSLLFLRHKKHVICEKPLASNQREAEQLVACARENQVVLFEAFKSAYLPNFLALQQALPKIGCAKPSSTIANTLRATRATWPARTPTRLIRSSPTARSWTSATTAWPARWRWFGAPQSVLASATLLDTGVDAHGTVCLNYGDFDVTLSHSKVSDSAIPSEIQGEEGTLIIDKISECQGVALTPRGGNRQDLSQPQHINTMLYEALAFAELVEKRQVEHPGLENSLIVARLLTDIRRQTGVVFPADGE